MSSRLRIVFSVGSTSTKAKRSQWPKCIESFPPAKGMAIFIYFLLFRFDFRLAFLLNALYDRDRNLFLKPVSAGMPLTMTTYPIYHLVSPQSFFDAPHFLRLWEHHD